MKKTCIKCKMKAIIIEKGEMYCSSCWFRHFSGETIEQYEKRVKQLDDLRKKK